MASKNITTIVSIVLVVIAFMGGVYLPKLLNKINTEQSTEQPREQLEIADNAVGDKTVKQEVKITPDYQPIDIQSKDGTNYKTEFIFTDMDAGREVPLSEFKGKLVVLNLWRTGCVICTYELRGLMKIKELYADKPIEFIALSLDSRGLGNVNHFLKQHKLNVKPIYMDTRNTIKHQRKSRTLPETLFIGPTGEILGSVAQPINWSSDESQKMLNSFLKQTGLD